MVYILSSYDNMIDKVTRLVDTLDRYVSGLSKTNITLVEIVTLVSALLAFLVSIISIIVTIKCDKKNRETSIKLAENAEKEENNRSKDAINANLTSNARIEWIQKVREATGELISSCYKFIRASKNEQKLYLDKICEKKDLYVLYFGPEKIDVGEKVADNLFDRDTNYGKNDMLVSFIEKLVSDIHLYHYYSDCIKNAERQIAECAECENSCIKIKCEKNEYGEEFNEEDCRMIKNLKYEEISTNRNKLDLILNDIRNLSEIMRIYCKLEWERAKKRI